MVVPACSEAGTSPKLHLPWSGPFVVMKRLSDLVYQIQDGPRSRMKIVHHNRLKSHYGQAPEWQEKRRAELRGQDDSEVRETDSPAEPEKEDVNHAEGAVETAGDSQADMPPDDSSAGVLPIPDVGSEGEDAEVMPSGRPRRRRQKPAYLDDYEA